MERMIIGTVDTEPSWEEECAVFKLVQVPGGKIIPCQSIKGFVTTLPKRDQKIRVLGTGFVGTLFLFTEWEPYEE